MRTSLSLTDSTTRHRDFRETTKSVESPAATVR